MIRSMTGFGEAAREVPEGTVRVEIRTVNHRHFNASLRTPRGLERHEPRIQSWIRESISRGHVNYSLKVVREGASAEEPLPQLDLDRARRYLNLLDRLRSELGVSGQVEVSDLARLGDVFRHPDPEEETREIDLDAVRDATREAARGVVAMREAEGARLLDDLDERIGAISAALDRIEERAPARLVDERDRLRERVRELTASREVDEDRLAREIAYLAEKWDISEEVVRFRAHVEHFRELLDAPSGEPAGKRLGFVVQEMHRETNTIGAKANDAEISQAVVGIKEEIERLREQVENVE